MIISGGVNIYPQECENLLITHPRVADAAVFGVPNETSAEVKAWSAPCGVSADAAFAVADRLLPRAPRAHEVPRSIDFMDAAPAADRQALQAAARRYWQGHGRSRIMTRRRDDLRRRVDLRDGAGRRADRRRFRNPDRRCSAPVVPTTRAAADVDRTGIATPVGAAARVDRATLRLVWRAGAVVVEMPGTRPSLRASAGAAAWSDGGAASGPAASRRPPPRPPSRCRASRCPAEPDSRGGLDALVVGAGRLYGVPTFAAPG
jgi:hypothetical protein